MPEVNIQIPGQGGLTQDRGRLRGTMGLSQALNVWIDPDLNVWTPRPTWQITAMTDQGQPGAEGYAPVLGGGAAWLPSSLSGSSRIECFSLYTGLSVTSFNNGQGRLPIPTLQRICSGLNGSVSHLGIFHLISNSIIGSPFPTGIDSVYYGRSAATIASDTYNTATIGATNTLTTTPVSAFGRIWYGSSEIRGTDEPTRVLVRWTSATGALSGAGTGELALNVPTRGWITGVTELNRRIVAVTDDAAYLIGSPSGGPPIDPNTSIAVLDTVRGLGTDVDGWVCATPNAVFVLGAGGLYRITADSFSNQPIQSLAGGVDVQTVARRFYQKCQTYRTQVGYVGLLGASVFWQGGQCLLFSSAVAGLTLYVFLRPDGSISVAEWEGRTPLYYDNVGPDLYGGFGSSTRTTPAFGNPAYLQRFPSDSAIGILRQPRANSYATFTPLIARAGSVTLESAYTCRLVTSWVSDENAGKTIYPKTVHVAARYLRSPSVTPGLSVTNNTWGLIQSSGQFNADVRSLRQFNLNEKAATAVADSGLGAGDYRTAPSFLGQMTSSGNAIGVGYEIADGRFVQFLVDSFNVSFGVGSSKRIR